jgi:hypothetical protein
MTGKKSQEDEEYGAVRKDYYSLWIRLLQAKQTNAQHSKTRRQLYKCKKKTEK